MTSTLPNYYEVLKVQQDAPLEVIQQAYNTLKKKTKADLNNSLTMQSARYTQETIEPAIRRYLLSGEQARSAYNRQLAEEQRRQTERREPADDEGLDTVLRTPFFFDPFDGYDTEQPAFSLRQIAGKLDNEWSKARAWITDTSNETHVFSGFLIHVAGRPRLAQLIAATIEMASRKDPSRMDTNEAIERCITLLDPQIERPTIGVFNPTFDGQTLDAGEFIPDIPAQAKLLLSHVGSRGCVFGKIESRTGWVRFARQQADMGFTLMPAGNGTGFPSEIKIPLFFDLSGQQRNTEHIAELVVCLENHPAPIKIPIKIRLHISALPPRVSFVPLATQEQPAWAGIVKQGESTSVVVIPRNHGDEEVIPLLGRVTSRDPRASANPARLRANEPVTLSVDTRNRPKGKKYEVVFDITYGITPGVRGPSALYVQGETLPTTWQSMGRQRSMDQRVITSLLAGFFGLLLLGGIGTVLPTHPASAWLLFLIIPLSFALPTPVMRKTIAAHIRRSGEKSSGLEKMPPLTAWGISTSIGIILALLCTFALNQGAAFATLGTVGFLWAGMVGFVVDGMSTTKEERASA